MNFRDIAGQAYSEAIQKIASGEMTARNSPRRFNDSIIVSTGNKESKYDSMLKGKNLSRERIDKDLASGKLSGL